MYSFIAPAYYKLLQILQSFFSPTLFSSRRVSHAFNETQLLVHFVIATETSVCAFVCVFIAFRLLPVYLVESVYCQQLESLLKKCVFYYFTPWISNDSSHLVHSILKMKILSYLIALPFIQSGAGKGNMFSAVEVSYIALGIQ